MSKAFTGKKGRPIWRLIAIEIVILCVSILLLFYLLQRYWAHRDGSFVPDYPMVTLTEESDYETIFLQTGLGRPAVDKLLEAGEFQTILDAQKALFYPPEVECTPLLGWFTREDRWKESQNDGDLRKTDSGVSQGERQFVDLQPGDILVTMSTHTGGWVHGHAGLVIDEDTTLECRVLGTDSGYGSVDGWLEYSSYAVLRVKGTTEELRQEVADYATEELAGVPYKLTAGFIGDKAPDTGAWYFGLHCAYLEWYAWKVFGYDLDQDGGRLVTAYDLLCSDKVEIVQIYGIDPRDFVH